VTKNHDEELLTKTQDNREEGGTMTTPQPPTRIYLAGPMFSAGDKMEQAALATALEAAGFECHVPQNNGIEVAGVMQLLNDPSLHGGTMLEPLVLDRCIVWVTRTVVALDVYQVVEGCQCTVLNIDGRVPDEGSLVEATLAWYGGHSVVPYKTTSISELGGNNNPMIGVISRWAQVSSDSAGVVAAVQAAVTASQPVTTPPPDVQQLIDLGRVVSGIRGRPPLDMSQRAAAEETLKMIPSQLSKLLEPVALLQEMCRQLVVAIIEFSKLGPGETTQQRKIFQDEIAALQAWMAQPGIRDAIINNPITC
jgi:nucleoside 2-deoxyribosyltransferase